MTRRWIVALAALTLPLGLISAASGAASALETSPKIVNGNPGKAGEFGFLASVYAYVGSDIYECGGAFVSSTQVVTAAHCFYDEDGLRLRDVRVGPASGTALPSTRVSASTIDIHQAYNIRSEVNDIAVITLSRPIVGVPVATIPTQAEWTAKTQGGSAVQSAGWGTTSSGGSSPSNFRTANLTVVPDANCATYSSTYSIGSLVYRGIGPDFKSSLMLCAGGATSRGLPIDTCQGDSGGPLVSGTTLVGIVSWGYGCAGMDDGKPIRLTPGVYTRLGAYLGWLAERGIGPSEEATAPNAPTGVSATVSGAGRFTVKWSAPTDKGGAPITGYRIEQSADDGEWQDLGFMRMTGTSTNITNVTPDFAYRYRVAAVNSAGQGAFSQPSRSVVMPAQTVTTPGKVSRFTNGRFVKRGNTYRVAVNWRSPADDGGSVVTGYVARVGLTGRFSSWNNFDEPGVLLTNLRPGRRYVVQVRAINALGRGSVASYTITTPRR
jgi:secreted trypsin-like serine protease